MYISPTLLGMLQIICQEKLKTFIKEISVLSFYETSKEIKFYCLAMESKDGTLNSVSITLPKN